MSIESIYHTITKTEDYSLELEKTKNNLFKKIQNNMNESTISSIFESEIYTLIENNFHIDDFHFDKEFTSKDFNQEFSGRIDMKHNGLLVEYKKPSALKTSNQQVSAQQQLIS